MSGNQAITRRGLICGGSASAALAALGAQAGKPEGEDYGLDDVSRRVPKRGRVQCPDVTLTTYRGEHIRYRQAAKIYTGFQQRLAMMERVASEVAIAVFGRKPHRLSHMGAFNCRRIKAYPEWISEHGLGNAIDLEGFDFAALARGKALPDGVPRQLRHGFSVRVLRHWNTEHPLLKHHRKFLRELARRLIARKDIFRVLLGPSYPGHRNHFHFDCAPFRMVDGFAAAD